MKKRLHYLVNQFNNVTKKNFKKAVKLSTYHDSMLKLMMDTYQSDPDWATLYNRYHPLHLLLVNAYNTWKSAGGIQEGQTLNVEQLLLLLFKKISRWDAFVQTVYAKDTFEYKSIFPNGHYPFNSGSNETRIQAVDTLGKTLDDYTPLSGVKTEVDAFYLTLDGAHHSQEAAIGGTKNLSSAVDSARRQAMIMQYGNMGFLINKYMNNTTPIDHIFDVSELSRHQQVLFTGALDPNENEAVLIHTFLEDDEIHVKITGATNTDTATLYLASVANGTNSNPVTISLLEPRIITISEFGVADYGLHRYLTIVNNNNEEIEYEIELI